MKKIFSRDNLALAFVCFVISFIIVWQLRSVYNNSQKAKVENLRLTQVQEELINEKHNNELLRSRIDELLIENNEIKDKKSAEEQLKQDIERASMIAGLTKVKGEGITITLSETAYDVVSEDYLLVVINELRAAGAEAIEVNGERMVATSEAREVGDRFIINGTYTNSPFKIKAIGDSNELYRSITMYGGVKELLSNIDFNVKKEKDLIIKAVKDDGTVIKTDYMTEVP